MTEVVTSKLWSPKILAWIDLLTAIALFLYVGNIILQMYLNPSFVSIALPFLLITIVPLVLINIYFSIHSFRLLSQYNIRGIYMSLVPKCIFLAISSLFVVLAVIDGRSESIPFPLQVSVLLILLIIFAIFVRIRMRHS